MCFPILGFRDCEDRRPDSRGTLSACFSGFPSRESSSTSSTASHDLTNLLTYWYWVISKRFLSIFLAICNSITYWKVCTNLRCKWMSQAFFQSHVAAGSKKTLYQTSRSSRGQLKRKSAGKTSSWEGRPTSPSMTKMIGSTYHIARNRSFGYRRFWLTSIISHSPALFSQGTSGSRILINFVTKISNFKWISALFQPEGRKNSTMTPRTDQFATYKKRKKYVIIPVTLT